MGDRTYVELFVLKEHAEEVKHYFGGFHYCNLDTRGECAVFGFEEVNYGKLGFLDKLENAGIAYDSNWSNGDEYGSGSRQCRFLPKGRMKTREVYDDDINPPIRELLNRIDDHAQLRRYILEHHERYQDWPWVDQIALGKLYKAYRLITT